MCARKKSDDIPNVDAAKEASVRERLMASYAGLTLFQTDIVETLSLLYLPVGPGKIFNVLKDRGARDDMNRAANHGSIVSGLRELEATGLVEVRNQKYCCARPVVELITRRMIAADRFAASEPLASKQITYTGSWGGYIDFESADHVVANVRLALYSMKSKRLDKVLDDISACRNLPGLKEYPISTVINNPFDADWLVQFPMSVQSHWMAFLLQDLSEVGENPDSAVAYALEHLNEFAADRRLVIALLIAEIAFLQGRFDEAIASLDEGQGVYRKLLIARRHLLVDSAEAAVSDYEFCLAAIKKLTGKRKPKFDTPDWPYFILALLDASESYWPRALELARWGVAEKGYLYGVLCKEFEQLILKQSGAAEAGVTRHDMWRIYTWREERSILFKYVLLLVDFWMGRNILVSGVGEIEGLCKRAAANGYYWLESEFAELLHRSGSRNKAYGPRAASLRASLGCRSLAEVIQPVEEWERALKALARLEINEGPAGRSEKQARLVWILSGHAGAWGLQPKEQKRTANGRWSAGRNVSLRRLYEEGGQLDFLTEQDVAVCRLIEVDSDRDYWGRSTSSHILPMTAFKALVGHTGVILEKTGASLDVVSAAPELRVSKAQGGFELKLIPPKPEHSAIHIESAGDTRVIVYEYTPDICKVAGILGAGISIPERAKDSVLEAVGKASALVTIHSDIGVGNESIPRIEADCTPVVLLLPSGDGLIVQLRVQPLSDGGPLFPPAAGGEVVIAEVNGARVQAQRDFSAERAHAAQVISACETLSCDEVLEGEWHLDDPEDCLELLMELEACASPKRVQWPKGQKYKILGSAGMSQFRVKIDGGHNWFELSGDVEVDEGLVLDMQRLLDLTSVTKSRFVELDTGQFVALTQAFRKKLDELRALSEERDGRLRMHALAAPAMDDLTEQAASVKANKNWKEQVQRLQHARALDPQIPTTLRATLRDYQIDGYKWLSRLAAWGVGACLADDMGLGKTVQILALMLERASGGPQLVVAPTSVCMNWEVEARRFAPTLRVRKFGTGDRGALLADLGPLDVVVCSYGLLHNESDLFKGVAWQTIVLDEAQAIKNMATKRSKAAMDLTGDFKIAATGTPIENHLGELWNLSRFINPGFLGSLEQFNKRFALPIEKFQEREPRHHLKQLIQPFILRRLKEDVLDELPPRTDIVLHVELGKEERAFYEALRLRALKQLSDAKEEPGKHYVRILAEIMRLRRACCNTRLVDEHSELSSAKLEVLEALLEELAENRHKALVFSQFVDHLSILRKVLDKKGVSYQYLDGSTPPKNRMEAVNAFQAGQGELFLISLKAGGLGLNLTAADYVIHLDPWWNPAVEDQASDRAHRIGQQRPVTVYRLVAKDTIEDQIVALHHQKRDLASSLLDGGDMAGKISSEQLLALLRNG